MPDQINTRAIFFLTRTKQQILFHAFWSRECLKIRKIPFRVKYQ